MCQLENKMLHFWLLSLYFRWVKSNQKIYVSAQLVYIKEEVCGFFTH